MLRSTGWALLIGLLLRGVLISLHPFDATGPDAGEYMLVGRYWREHGTIPDERGTPAVAPPLLPLLIAGATTFGDRPGVLGLKVLNLVWSAAAILLAVRLARRIPGVRRPTLAGWLIALHPALIRYSADVSTDVPFVALLLGGLELACLLSDRPRGRTIALLGLLIGAAALLRPASVPGSALLGVALVILGEHGSMWRRVGTVALVALVGAATIAPWSIFVSLRFGERILLSDTAGYNFWDGHHPVNHRVRGTDDLVEREKLSAIKHEEMRQIVARCREQGLGRSDRSAAFYAAAQAHMRVGDPTLLQASADNLWSLLRAWPDPVVHGLGLSLLFALFGLPVGTLGVVGLIACTRRRRGVLEVGAAGLLLGLTVLAVAFVGLVRYRFVHLDPILIVFVPAGFQAVEVLLHRRSAALVPTGRLP